VTGDNYLPLVALNSARRMDPMLVKMFGLCAWKSIEEITEVGYRQAIKISQRGAHFLRTTQRSLNEATSRAEI